MALSAADKYTFTYQAWAESFTIFAKYDGYAVDAQHDEIYAGPNPEKVSAEDKARLEQIGWHIDEDNNCFYRFT